MVSSPNPLSTNVCNAFRAFQNGEFEPEEDSIDIPDTTCDTDKEIIRSVRPLFKAIQAYAQELDSLTSEKISKAQREWSRKKISDPIFHLYPFYNATKTKYTVQDPTYLNTPKMLKFCCNPSLDHSCALKDWKILGNRVMQDFTRIISYLDRNAEPETQDLPRDFENLTRDFQHSFLNFYCSNPDYST